MRRIYVHPDRNPIPLGCQGDNLINQIAFDIFAWQQIEPNGIVTLLHKRANDEHPYPVTLELDGRYAVWNITAADTGYVGKGCCQLYYTLTELDYSNIDLDESASDEYDDTLDVLSKSPIFRTAVARSIDCCSEIPDPFADWAKRIIEQAQMATKISREWLEEQCEELYKKYGVEIFSDDIIEYLSNNPEFIEGFIESSVSKWLSEHPEATTTIQDGSVTEAKLNAQLVDKIDNGGSVNLGNLFDLVMPVGYVYLSVDDVNPGVLFGGTWEKFGDGRMLIGTDADHSAEETGGSKTATLAVKNLPSHTHTFTGTAASHTHSFTGKASSHTHTFTGTASTTSSNGAHTHKLYQGSFNITQPTGGSYYGMMIYYNQANLATTSNGAHTHTVTASGTNSSASITPSGTNASTSITPKGTNSNTGSGEAFSIMAPHIYVNMWKRIA